MHAITDGRDVPPKSARAKIAAFGIACPRARASPR
jgi:bisphosphoglycerate-independent phosphoglycerate mutase (AlkP superfamily)